MGNDTSKPPQNYNQKVVHSGEFLQTYPGGTGDKVDLVTGSKPMAVGVKILQSVDYHTDENDSKYGPGEYYVEKPNGRRVYLTKGGTYKAQVASLVSQGAHYGEGPAIMISGTVGAPKYTVFSSTSTSAGADYTAMTVSNVGDFQKAVWYGHEKDTKGAYAASYGSAAINPFQERPRNAFSTLADIGRGALKVLDTVAVPVIEWGLDAVTDDIAGTLLQVTGLDTFLQQGLDKLTEMHGIDYSSASTTTAPYFTDIVKDPRLGQNFDKLMGISIKKTMNKAFATNKYQKELHQIVGAPHWTNAQKMLSMQKLEEMNLRFDAQQQLDILAKTVKLLKKMVPNPPNMNWDLVQQGLDNASDPAMQIEFAERTTENIMSRVVPFMKKQAAAQPKPQTSTAKPAETKEKKASDPTEKLASGFINGQRKEDQHPSRITGFIPAS